MSGIRLLEKFYLDDPASVAVRIDEGSGHSCIIDARGVFPAFRRVSHPDTPLSYTLDDTWVRLETVISFYKGVSELEVQWYHDGATAYTDTPSGVVRVGHRHLYLFDGVFGPSGWVQAECTRIKIVDEVPR